MSKMLSKVKIHSDEEFKAATRMERLYMSVMEPDRFILNNPDQVYLDKLRQIYGIIAREVSQIRATKKIKALNDMVDCQPATIAKMINDTKDLFGNAIKSNRDFDRAILVEKFLWLARKSEKEGTEKGYEVARRCYVNVKQLNGLDAVQKVSEINPDDLKLPTVVLTYNPAALIEDIQHEEVK